jgi:molybdenum cofactor cytidylyltransferase
MKDIWAIVLAAGESKRMGFPKMLLIFKGKSMLENVIENIKLSNVNHILVVTGAETEKITDLASSLGVTCCYNDRYKEGMLSSVKCGFRNLPEDFDAVLVFQGDQPLIKPAVINSVIEAFRSSVKNIVIPLFRNKRGHPLLIGREYRDKIDNLDSNEGLRSLANIYKEDVLEIETNDPCILRDFDTYEEYSQEINQIS